MNYFAGQVGRYQSCPTTCRGCSATAQRGFTLIELLVVIGIIGLLISLLVPALARSKAAARTTACLSNVHQLAAASVIYAVDNGGLVIPFGPNTVTVGTTQVTTSWCNVNTLTTGGSQSSYVGAYISPYCTNQNILICPEGLQDGYGLPFSTNPNYYGICVPNQSLRLISQLTDAAETADFADSLWIVGAQCSYSASVFYPTNSGPGSFAGRHNGDGNVGFYDGHGETLPSITRPQNAFLSTPSNASYQAQLTFHLGELCYGKMDTTKFTDYPSYITYGNTGSPLSYYFRIDKGDTHQ